MFHWRFSTQKDRPQSWYIAALIVVLFLVIYGIVEELYMMSIVAFLFAGVYIMKENNEAPVTEVEVTDTGIAVQNTFYEFSQIASFAILFDQSVPRILRCFLRKGITQTIDIPLTQDVNPTELKKFLLEHIEENMNAEFSKSDHIIQAMRL